MIPICSVAVVGCSIGADDKAALDSYPGFVCTTPAEVQYAAWGPRGLSKSCKAPDGKSAGSFLAAEHGHIVMQGQYMAGKERGTWEWLGHDGKVQKRRQFDVPSAR